MPDGVLEDTLGVNGNQLTDLFRKTVGPNYMDNFQKILAWHCYCLALLIHGKLSRYGMAISPTCPMCGGDSETVLECPELVEWRTYV